MSVYRFQGPIVPLEGIQKFVEGAVTVKFITPGVQVDIGLDNDKDLPDLTEYMLENNFEFVAKVI